jgi:hypothetical protein
VGEGEQVSGKGYGAGQRKEISRTDADKEVLRRCSGWGREKEQAGEGEKGSDGSRPTRGRCVSGTKGWDDGEERDEDDNEAGDEGRFRGGGAGEAGGLELIAGCEEEADDQTGEECMTAYVAKLTVIHDGECEERERHAEEVEEEGGGILERVFDQDEGGSPDEDYGE